MQLSKAIRKAYFTTLNGAVLNGLDPIPVYDTFALPEDVNYPYIIISTQTNLQNRIDRCRFWNCTILIDIVTGDIDPIGRDLSEDIAEQIENLINPSNYEDLVLEGGYEIGNTFTDSDTDLQSKNDTHYIYRKILTYNHLISKSDELFS